MQAEGDIDNKIGGKAHDLLPFQSNGSRQRLGTSCRNSNKAKADGTERCWCWLLLLWAWASQRDGLDLMKRKGVPFSAAAWDFLDTREGLSRVTRKVDVDVNVKPRCLDAIQWKEYGDSV